MKKLLCALLAVMLFAGAVYAEGGKIGVLAKLNMSEAEFSKLVEEGSKNGRALKFSSGVEIPGEAYIFYDSLMSLLLALNAGEVNEIHLPEDVADYVLNVNDAYKISSITRMTSNFYLSFGFRAGDSPALRNSFNEALMSMKADGTISILQTKYISDAGLDAPEPVKFEHYDNVDKTIKVAVTGDMPPIDFIAEDGTPAGFNTAVLAEIGKRLKINIELVNIDSGARAAALASGRVDAVFWFMALKGASVHADVPESITLSEPYYSWNEILSLVKK
ncbi:MAG: transporter substrate-binding domain-containing protein [Synergistaceae bacterium]|nr:transporter substrate-binding domain-containing protein [Synergistaceae bacterium]